MHSGYYARSNTLKNFEHGERKMCGDSTTDKRKKLFIYIYVVDIKLLTIFFQT